MKEDRQQTSQKRGKAETERKHKDSRKRLFVTLCYNFDVCAYANS